MHAYIHTCMHTGIGAYVHTSIGAYRHRCSRASVHTYRHIMIYYVYILSELHIHIHYVGKCTCAVLHDIIQHTDIYTCGTSIPETNKMFILIFNVAWSSKSLLLFLLGRSWCLSTGFIQNVPLENSNIGWWIIWVPDISNDPKLCKTPVTPRRL